MAIQRLRDQYLYVSVFLGDTVHENGQIALQVHTGSEEVRDNDEPLYAACDQQIGSFFNVRAAKFEKRGFHVGVVAGACEVSRRLPDSLVGRFDSGAVGEDDDPGSHALLMYWRM